VPCPPGRPKRTVALVTSQPVIRTMDESDPEVISGAFTAIGWHKPPGLFQRYLAEREEGRRLAFVAERHGEFAGYVTLLWASDYSPFAERQVPEVCDLNVLPPHRRQGIGNALLDRAESAASARRLPAWPSAGNNRRSACSASIDGRPGRRPAALHDCGVLTGRSLGRADC
jgi:GNAT superfamily N-acetyltransferase